MTLRPPTVSFPLIVSILLALPAAGRAQDKPLSDTLAPVTKMPVARDPLSTTLIEVSTRRVRIAFPVDTVGTWVWHGRRAGHPIYGHVWQALVEGMDGPVSIGIWVYPSDSAIRFSSLEEVVKAGSSSICLPGMVQTCREVPVGKSVEGERVVVTLDDPAVISRLFGTRPARVSVNRQSVDEEPSWESDSVPVRYVAPQIPQPDSALLAEAERGRRRYEASITSISRTLSDSDDGWDTDDLWVAAGDSIPVNLVEMHCHYDSCGESREVSDSGWSVRDSNIVRIRPTCGAGCVYAYGRRAGKTMISARGLHGPSDTMPSREPPARSIERRITVGRPIARVAIVSRRDTVLLGQPYTFRARAFDRAGRVIPDVPIELSVDIGPYRMGMVATRPTPVEFRVSGRRAVVATFRGLADTLMVTVVDKKKGSG